MKDLKEQQRCNMIIRKVWKATSTGSKVITIPRKCDIVEGDYVKIEKVVE